MSTDIRHRGRPRGQNREALTTWMEERPRFTMGELSRSLGWPVSVANQTLKRAKQAGEVRISGTEASPGAKRPVAVFERAGSERSQDSAALQTVFRLWNT